MLQQPVTAGFVIATGETQTVREFAELAFAHAGLDSNDDVVTQDALLRPAEVDLLLGDPTKAKAVLEWEPEVRFAELVAMMVDADMA